MDSVGAGDGAAYTGGGVSVPSAPHHSRTCCGAADRGLSNLPACNISGSPVGGRKHEVEKTACAPRDKGGHNYKSVANRRARAAMV